MHIQTTRFKTVDQKVRTHSCSLILFEFILEISRINNNISEHKSILDFFSLSLNY